MESVGFHRWTACFGILDITTTLIMLNCVIKTLIIYSLPHFLGDFPMVLIAKWFESGSSGLSSADL